MLLWKPNGMGQAVSGWWPKSRVWMKRQSAKVGGSWAKIYQTVRESECVCRERVGLGSKKNARHGKRSV
jgi:hypothetical protein